MSQLRRVSGTVVRLCCQSCHRTFPHFRFEGEGDADTAGLGSLSSCMENEVVIAEMSASEWNNSESSGAQKFQDRLSSQLGRSDLRAVQLLRVHHSQSSPVSVTFQEFRKQFVPPQVTYSCPCCTHGESSEASQSVVEEYLRSGGHITLIGDLQL